MKNTQTDYLPPTNLNIPAIRKEFNEILNSFTKQDLQNWIEFANQREISERLQMENRIDLNIDMLEEEITELEKKLAQKRRNLVLLNECHILKRDKKNEQETISSASIDYEYELFFKSEIDDVVVINGWFPIATEMIKNIEKIDKYISGGLLRKKINL